MRAPISGCARTSVRSLSVSGRGLVHQLVGDAHTADVVEDAGEPHPLDRVRREAELARDQLREAADAMAVADAPAVAHVQGLGEAEQRGQLHARLPSCEWTACARMPGHLRARDHGAVAAQALGRVERVVGGSQERIGRTGHGGERWRRRTRPPVRPARCRPAPCPPIPPAPPACTRRARRSPGASSANSSPPMRAAESNRRLAERIVWAIPLQRHVAGGVAEVVPLTRLKRSRSPTIRLNGAVAAAGALGLASNASSKPRRLSRSVRGSCWAASASRSR